MARNLRRMINVSLIFICLVFNLSFLSSSALGYSFFVRPLSSSNYGLGDGSSYDNAWNGFKSIKWGVGNGEVGPGDTLYICGVHNEMLRIGCSGNSDQSVVISGAYPTEAGIIDGKGTVGNGVYSDGAQYVNIQQLEIRQVLKNGIYLIGPNYDGTDALYIGIYGCNIHDMSGNGISFRGSDVIIFGCNIHNIGLDGIYGRGKRTVITNCSINNVSKAGLGDCIQLSTNAEDFYVAYNNLDHSNNGNKQCFIVNSTVDQGGVFEFNNCVGLAAGDHYVVQARHKGAIIRYNTIEGGKYCIGINEGDVYYNVLKNAYMVGIRIQGDGKGPIRIYNNTIVNSGVGIYHDSQVQVELLNNIITDCKSYGIKVLPSYIADIAEDYNCVYNNGQNYFGIKRGANSIEEEPQFVDAPNNDFRIMVGSPCAAQGVRIELIHPTIDLKGASAPLTSSQRPSIGAHESFTVPPPENVTARSLD